MVTVVNMAIAQIRDGKKKMLQHKPELIVVRTYPLYLGWKVILIVDGKGLTPKDMQSDAQKLFETIQYLPEGTKTYLKKMLNTWFATGNG